MCTVQTASRTPVCAWVQLTVQPAPTYLQREQLALHMKYSYEADLKGLEAERRRLASRLHDRVQQDLAALLIQLDLIAARQSTVAMPSVGLEADARTLVEGAIDELHQVINDLWPTALSLLGLIPALDELIDSVVHRSSLQIEFEVLGDRSAIDRLGNLTAVSIYRLVAASLENVVAHAQAGFVHLVMDLSDPARLVLHISDDGVGIDESAVTAPTSLGLMAMANRIDALGGRFDIRRGHSGEPLYGTTVTAEIPVPGG